MDAIIIGETMIIGILILVLATVYIMGRGFWSIIFAKMRKESIIFEINASTGKIDIIRAKKFSEGVRTKDNRVYSTENCYYLEGHEVFFVFFDHGINLNLDVSREMSALINMAKVLGVNSDNKGPNNMEKGISNISVIAKAVSERINYFSIINNETKSKITDLKKKLNQETDVKIIKEKVKEIEKLDNTRENISSKFQNIIKILLNTDAVNFKSVQDYLHQNIPLSASAIAGTVAAAENVGRMYEKKDFSKSLAYILLVGGFIIVIIYMVMGANSGLSDCQSALNTCVHTINNIQNATTILPAR